jgi:GxxExxY protein
MDKDPRTYAIIGAAMEVHGELGNGFLEAVYQEALGFELAKRNTPFSREVRLPIKYKGNEMQTFYIADFICYDDIIVETKAIKTTTEVEQAQVINYLKATGFRIGLLLNFGVKSLEYKRFIRSTR